MIEGGEVKGAAGNAGAEGKDGAAVNAGAAGKDGASKAAAPKAGT